MIKAQLCRLCIKLRREAFNSELEDIVILAVQWKTKA